METADDTIHPWLSNEQIVTLITAFAYGRRQEHGVTAFHESQAQAVVEWAGRVIVEYAMLESVLAERFYLDMDNNGMMLVLPRATPTCAVVVPEQTPAEPLSPAVKRCYRCGLHLPVTAFSPDTAKRDGLASACRACKNTMAQDRYATDPAYRAQTRGRAQASRHRRAVTPQAVPLPRKPIVARPARPRQMADARLPRPPRPAPEPTVVPADAPPTDLAIGDRVAHARFGVGTVAGLTAEGRVVIQFRDGVGRTLDPRYAKLTPA